jgi:hypothetical protein
MALTELAEKGADIDVLRQMVQFMAQRLMELDVEARCGAGDDEKNPEPAPGTSTRVAKMRALRLPRHTAGRCCRRWQM